MLNIDFKVDCEIIAREIISKSRMPEDFANYLWDKYRDSYRELQNEVNSQRIDKEIIRELQKQPFFKFEIENGKQNSKRIKKL